MERQSPAASEEYAISVINGGWENWNLFIFIDLSQQHVNAPATGQFNGFREKSGCITHSAEFLNP